MIYHLIKKLHKPTKYYNIKQANIEDLITLQKHYNYPLATVRNKGQFVFCFQKNNAQMKSEHKNRSIVGFCRSIEVALYQ
jgi:hypothetical protein